MKVSAKRQIILPIELCALADIDKGDEVDSFVDRQGIISIVKKSMGAASGTLKDTKANRSISEDFDQRRAQSISH
jgi:bifunctional DNA-binding transcriptional regulator/antitoxin component of YhaV-PrlF toxin-antitoxin module